jgi:hypothetical protein
MVASFAELLVKVRNTFIVAGHAKDDAPCEENEFSWNLPRHDSEPWSMSVSSLSWDRDIKLKCSDSDVEFDSSDSTIESQNENPDWDPSTDSSDTMSSFGEIDMARQVTEECWLDDAQWQPEAELASRATSCEASSESGTNIEFSESDDNHSVAEVVEEINAAEASDEVVLVEHCSDVEVVALGVAPNIENGTTKERIRWADVIDEHELGFDAVEAAKKDDVKAVRLPPPCTSPEEGGDGIALTKLKRSNRRKSLIDKAVQEQHPCPPQRRSKLRSTAPVFVPIPIEAEKDAGKKICTKCGASAEQHFKFCNICGTSFSKLPTGFMSMLIQ